MLMCLTRFRRKLTENKMEALYDIIKLFFIASIVFLLHHKTPLLKPFDDMILIFNSFSGESKIISGKNENGFKWFSVIPQKKNYQDDVKVALIDKDIFYKEYSSISPLDKCELAHSLENIFVQKPKIVAIDIDISPLCTKKLRENCLIDHYNNCQELIDNQLKKNAKFSKIIILDPTKYQGIRNSCLEHWKNDLEKKGIIFADPTFDLSLGVALYYPSSDKPLGKMVSDLVNKENLESEEKIPINYSFNIKPSNSKLHSESIVFIGGSYENKEFYTTPIGNVPGVFIHTLGYLSFKYPKKEIPILGYLLDISFAFVVYIFITCFWEKILSEEKDYLRDFYYLFNLISILGLSIASLFIAYLLFNCWHILVSPIPILIGVLFDGLSGSVLETCEEKHDNKEISIHKILASKWFYFKMVLMIGFIIYSPFYIVFSH